MLLEVEALKPALVNEISKKIEKVEKDTKQFQILLRY